MNYFELINKCLVELNYKQEAAFIQLSKNEHKKLKNIINLINSEVCSLEKWNFLLRETSLELPAKTNQITNTINGRISTIVIDGQRYKYFDDFEKFFTNTQPEKTYTSFNDKLLFPLFDKDKEIHVIYYTSDTSLSEDGTEKKSMEKETDKSLIPEVFAEPILVYGSCMRLKGNPQHPRFNYWYSMYKEALANMKAKLAIDANVSPQVNLFRT